ncbi:MAG TPA: DUF488 domain-containing protein [Syntrophales bacterium]|nr:DUF488 domain-containing protein [Syntrophales bacterium]HOL60096.1 DUF488 domain-containing protein [Syntrophales bacterium]HPO35348.1 DUF488 domain-containing protein [Syntrophales bacterium]
MKGITLFTIGFAGKKAETFFGCLIDYGVKRLLDIRLFNTSQLTGYTKKEDLAYFLRVIGGMEYLHLLELAPTEEMFRKVKGKGANWSDWSKEFRRLLEERQVEKTLSPSLMDMACLLCSEASPNRCHRRLVAEYLKEKWGNVEIRHL